MIETGFAPPVDIDGGRQLSASRSAASWPAIIAGAFVAIATSLILIALGSGVGFATISPWANHGVSAATFTVTGVIWLIVTQWISAAIGGYVAGRMRTRWIGTHTHEVFFRDTAHGLITWSVATVLIAGTLAGSLLTAAGGGARLATDVASAQGKAPKMSDVSPRESYEIERLLRMPGASNAQGGQDPRAEVSVIAASAALAGNWPDTDRVYLAQLVSARTGLAQTDAQKRVDDFVASMNDAKAKAMSAAEEARKAAAEMSLYLALSLLVGAFIASVSAALGGRLRDEHP